MDRVMSRVEKVDGHWLYVGSSDGKGYGKVAFAMRKTIKTHVLAYLYHHGDIPANTDVCHKCNVKNCINPEHLYLGTRSENVQHAHRDGLVSQCRLTNEQAMEVFKQANEGQKYQRDIAKDFGIDQQMVSMIKRKRAFKWIHG
jgi:hypothetical protein